MFDRITQQGNLMVVSVRLKRMGSEEFTRFANFLQGPAAGRAAAVLFDLSGVERINFSGLAALLQTHKSAQRTRPVFFAGKPKRGFEKFSECGLMEVLPIFDTLDAALCSAELQAYQLAGHRAVVLCAGKGTRAAPLTDRVPKPMLEIFGKPILHHILDHLDRFGLRDIILNPGHLGPKIHQHFGSGRAMGKSIFYLNEGGLINGEWQAHPLGSATTLARLNNEHSAFDEDVIVLCGDALIDIDLAAMMACHRNSGALATIAAKHVTKSDTQKYGIIVSDSAGRITSFQEKPAPGTARSNLANVGIYIFSPAALDLLPPVPNLDIATDFLPAIMRSKGRIQIYQSDFHWTDVGCGRDYYNAVAQCLSDPKHNLLHAAHQVRPGIWLSEGAQLSRLAKVKAPCFLGNGAIVKAGATLAGPVSIGAGCIVERGALVSESLVIKDTCIETGAIVSGMIAAPDWAIAHRFADGNPVTSTPLECVARQPSRPAQQPALKFASS